MDSCFNAAFTYTREQILALKKNHQLANLPPHLFAPDYLTSHGKFSPDKYVECMWKGERNNRKPAVRSEIPDILQNGSTLSPQRRGFSSGCREAVDMEADPFLRRRAINTAAGASLLAGSQSRGNKTDKRFPLNASSSGNNNNMTWRKFPFFDNNGESGDGRFDGYNRSNGFSRRDSNSHAEAMPEWMDDGPESSTDLIPLHGFNDIENDLKQTLEHMRSNERNQGAELLESLNKGKLTLPASDVEFAATFGILDVADIESKILSDRAQEPKASRLSRFFGYDGRPTEEPPQVHEAPSGPDNSSVLPAVARLLSGGSKTMGGGMMGSPSSGSPIFNKPTPDHSHFNEQPASQSPQYPSAAVEALMQKSKNNIDLVPTAVMLQRSNAKEEARHDFKAPAFNNPTPPTGAEHSEHPSYSPQLPPSRSTPLMESHGQPAAAPVFPAGCMPAIAQLGSHFFPVPNMLAVAMDTRQLQQAYQNSNYAVITLLQARLNAQMQVHAALQQFRHDPSLVLVNAADGRFGEQLAKLVDQQRSLDANLSSKPSSVSMSRASPVEGKTADIEESLRNVTVDGSGTKRPSHANIPLDHAPAHSVLYAHGHANNGSAQEHREKLAILEKLPSSARPLTVEELEQQMMGR
ncbi:hypothetical protein M3Y99_01351100 [Aphelenchoides fujianensis]|nr:hypothetical protein M3Y99_01351100 [Aphelenchoides fujianensis]